LRKRVVAAEISRRSACREPAPSRTIEHHPGHELLDCAYHRLERAHVCRFVDIDDREPRATRFGFTATESSRHPRATRLDRRGLYDETTFAVLHDRDRRVVQFGVTLARSNHRPVGAPQAAHANIRFVHEIRYTACASSPTRGRAAAP
jgi:hypothetical protein